MVGCTCAVSTCHNSWKRKKKEGRTDLAFHRFPSNPEIRRQWELKCRRADDWNPATSCICSEHFVPGDDYVRTQADFLGIGKKKTLKPTAVPSLKLPRSKKVKTPGEPKMMSITKESPSGCIYVFTWVEPLPHHE